MSDIRMRDNYKGVLNRNVTRKECPWLDEDINLGTTVYKYYGPTYGCIDDGIPVTLLSDKTPFMEVPEDSVDWEREETK